MSWYEVLGWLLLKFVLLMFTIGVLMFWLRDIAIELIDFYFRRKKEMLSQFEEELGEGRREKAKFGTH